MKIKKFRVCDKNLIPFSKNDFSLDLKNTRICIKIVYALEITILWSSANLINVHQVCIGIFSVLF